MLQVAQLPHWQSVHLHPKTLVVLQRSLYSEECSVWQTALSAKFQMNFHFHLDSKGITVAEETGAKLKPGFDCCPCPQGSPEPCNGSTLGPLAPIGLTGPYVTGGPVGPDILNTGVVLVSKAPLLDTTPAGDVEGLIGAGPLMTSKKHFNHFPLLF